MTVNGNISATKQVSASNKVTLSRANSNSAERLIIRSRISSLVTKLPFLFFQCAVARTGAAYPDFHESIGKKKEKPRLARGFPENVSNDVGLYRLRSPDHTTV